MRPDLMDILVCPMCKAELELSIRKQDGDEIVEGKLTCTECREDFLIEDGIPNMLPPDMRDD